MHKRLLIACFWGALLLAGSSVSHSEDSRFTPSIKSLKANETLIVNIVACHWECQIGSIEIAGTEAKTMNRGLTLLPNEIDELDDYFLRGSESSRCSLPILINFEKMIGSTVAAEREAEVFPCSFEEGLVLDPLALLHYLDEDPHEVPHWRLTPEEQAKRDSLTDKFE